MAQKILGAQFDFSSGEVDVTLKRNDTHPARKTGLRQCANMRILDTNALQQRPGRRAMFLETGRVDKVLMSPGNRFYLAFGFNGVSGTLKVYSSLGVQLFTQSGFNWNDATALNIVWVQDNLKSIYIFLAGQVPQVLTWDGVSIWSATSYAETVTSGNQKRTFFYRISPRGVTMQPAATTGSGVACTFSAGMNLTAAHIGTRLRFVNRQVLITAVADATHATIMVEEALPPGQLVSFGAVDPRPFFNVGEVVIGSTTGAKAVVTATSAVNITVQLLAVTVTQTNVANNASAILTKDFGSIDVTLGFSTGEILVGPGGSFTIGGLSTIAPQAVTYWDDEVMNSLRGYPASGFFDQGRLGMCDFPAVPNGIGWSAIGLPTDLYVDGSPTAAIFEIAPNRTRVMYVVPGAEGAEFIFGDNRVYYIPISVTNPLKPGSVEFKQISGDGTFPVLPRSAGTAILFLAAGGLRMSAIVAVGATNRPYDIANLNEVHTHLFATPIAIAVPTADGTFSERYVYVLMSNGIMAVGKYTLEQDQAFKGISGWVPWFTPNAAPQWISALESEVTFTTVYVPNAIAPVKVVEALDDTVYLDAAISVNSPPGGLTPPLGKGPFWWLPGGSVDLMDQVTRWMGTYQIDADGNIIPQFKGGENLLAASLVGGQAFTATVEPFCPDAPAGQDVGQRMKKREISQFAAYVIHQTGFKLGHLFSFLRTPTTPAPGTLMNFREFPAYNTGRDPTLPALEQETAEIYNPQGSSFDPRPVLIKDVPGPLQLLELGIEVSI